MSFGFKFDPFSKGGMSAPDYSKQEDGSLNFDHLKQIANIFNTPAFEREIELAVYEVWQHANRENYDVCMATAENLRLLYARFEALNKEYFEKLSEDKKSEEYEENSEQQFDNL